MLNILNFHVVLFQDGIRLAPLSNDLCNLIRAKDAHSNEWLRFVIRSQVYDIWTAKINFILASDDI